MTLPTDKSPPADTPLLLTTFSATPTAAPAGGQPTSRSAPLGLPSPTLRGQHPLAHTSDTTSITRVTLVAIQVICSGLWKFDKNLGSPAWM